MKVAELVAPGKFQLVDQPVREPAPGEVQVRVHSVGVCGSDLHNFLEGSVGDTPSSYPMVLGHEPAGTVARIGAGLTGWQPGDRVAIEPAVYCYHCEFCRAGRHNVCAHIRFMSMPGDPGFFREYVTVPAANLLPLPESLGLREATLFEPLAVVLHSMEFARPQPGETAAVFGAGPIGLLTVAVLKILGAGRVWAVEPVEHRRALATAAGADATLDPSAAEPALTILRETGNRGVDVAIDCAARGESMNQCLRATRNAGRVVVTGIPSEIRVPLEFHVMRRKELAVFNVRRSNHESHQALELLREQPHRFAHMITHVRSLGGVEAGFQMLAAYANGVGKLVIEPRG